MRPLPILGPLLKLNGQNFKKFGLASLTIVMKKSSISSQISKHQEDLDMESKIMDSLAIKTERVKVLNVKLEQVEKQVHDLVTERQ